MYAADHAADVDIGEPDADTHTSHVPLRSDVNESGAAAAHASVTNVMGLDM
ncbi:MAG: hypothetical protein AB1704_33010 [Pseudomonadota bacterium]|jgi:hypothetical protein|uniref:hypothetical protein n=1 Tax=Paraburkholderia sp. TaxID=1926495 RepID=UPI0034781BF2